MRRSRSTAVLLAPLVLAGCNVLGPAGDEYSGEFSGQLLRRSTSGIFCTWPYAVTGRVELELEEESNGVSGEGTIFFTGTPGSPTPSSCGPAPDRKWDGSGAISGTASEFRFSHEYTASGFVTVTTRSSFAGALSNGVVTGVVTITWTGVGPSPESAAGTFNVTLNKK